MHRRINPEWKVDAAFINDCLVAALRLDAKLSSHPIEVEVPDAGQIGQIFDSLSYSKAASGTLLTLIKLIPLRNDHSTPHAIEFRRRGQIPQGCLSVPQKTLVLEHRLSPLMGGYQRGDWYVAPLDLLITYQDVRRTGHS